MIARLGLSAYWLREAVVQILVEAEVDVHLLVDGAVERTDVVGAVPHPSDVGR